MRRSLRASLNDIPASASQVQAGMNTTFYVTPAQQQYHPSAVAAAVNFTSGGTINYSYNVTTVTRNGTGDFTINLLTTMATVNYVVVANQSSAQGNPPIQTHPVSLTTVSFGVVLHQTTSGQEPAAAYNVHVIVVGQKL